MNQASLRAGTDGLDRMRDALLGIAMLRDKRKQQELDNSMRREMVDYQKQRDGVGDARYTDQTTYARGRDAVSDQRYTDQTGYARGRDALSDTRYTEQTGYSRGRDAAGDQRADRDFLLRAQQAEKANEAAAMERALRERLATQKPQSYETETIDPSSGEVINLQRRRPVYSTGQQAATAAPAASPFAAAEGKTVTGPDGKRYKIVNGQPQPLQ